jgi:hypothetical protein
MMPEREFPNLRPREIRRQSEIELHDAGANVHASYVDAENGVERFEHQGGGEVHLRCTAPMSPASFTRYGSLVAWAKQLGRNDCAAVLQQNLDEEKATDKKLTALAEAKVNRQAA